MNSLHFKEWTGKKKLQKCRHYFWNVRILICLIVHVFLYRFECMYAVARLQFDELQYVKLFSVFLLSFVPILWYIMRTFEKKTAVYWFSLQHFGITLFMHDYDLLILWHFKYLMVQNTQWSIRFRTNYIHSQPQLFMRSNFYPVGLLLQHLTKYHLPF